MVEYTVDDQRIAKVGLLISTVINDANLSYPEFVAVISSVCAGSIYAVCIENALQSDEMLNDLFAHIKKVYKVAESELSGQTLN